MDQHVIVPQVCSAIESLGYRCLRSVKCTSVGKTIVLQGIVRSFYFKQLSQTAAAKVAGVERVRNEIEVVDDRG